jgi:hypothetical protein
MPTALSPEAVYLMESDRDDPRGEGFARVDTEEPALLGDRGWGDGQDRLRDFYPSFPIKENWTPPQLANVWRPLRVTGRVQVWNDFPTVSMVIPAFSQRAVEVLRDVLERNGELLPLKSDYGQWWAYNLRTVADIVNLSKSTAYEADRNSQDVRRNFEHFVLYENRLRHLLVFRIRQDLSGIYVTQPFVDRVRQAGLRNIVFAKIWPWPSGTIWRLENTKLRRARKAYTKASSDLRQHAVVIRLGTGGKAKPNKQQREQVQAIMSSLDALLADPYAAHDAPTFGNLEGDEPVLGEHRLFLSCPDADQLVERLRPWLRHLDWLGPVEVVKRYGDLHDEGAREEAAPRPW